jgi:RND family efflux transporter MFP subunit
MSDGLSSDLAALRIDRDGRDGRDRPPSRGKLKIVIWLAVLAGLGALGYFVLMPYLSARVWKASVKVTEVALVSPAASAGGGVDLTTSGYVKPQRTSKVGARIAGRLLKVNVVEGDQVKQGDVLAILDDADIRASIATANARVSAARARAATARAQVAEAEQQAARARALFDKGAGSKAEADDAEARTRSLRAAVSAADADVRAAQAEVAVLEVNLQFTTITAPIDGTVISKPQEVGEQVSLMVPTPIVELVDFGSLVVETDVPESKLGLVQTGAPAEITLDAFPGQRFRGESLVAASKVDRAKATIAVKVKFVDPTTGVLPDMAARVAFLKKPMDEAALKAPPKVVVPGEAVTERGGVKVVFVVDSAAGVVKQTPVTLGAPFGDGFELAQGPAAGTKLVRSPSADLQDGQRIKEEP